VLRAIIATIEKQEPVTFYLVSTRKPNSLFENLHEYSIYILDVLTVNDYQNIAKIVDHKVDVQSVVGKSVVAGIVIINQR
jgi:hypothetical protein